MTALRAWGIVAAIVAMVATGCGDGSATDVAANPVLQGTGEVASGAELYAANCAVCHGVDATGTTAGPPFLHEVYVPSHHGDGAFLSAVRNGVQAHHWDFGPMPPVQGLSDQDVADIVAWVRQQQREAGVID